MGYPFHERWRHRGYLVRSQPRMLIFRLYAVPRCPLSASARRLARARRHARAEIGGPQGYVEELGSALNLAGLLRKRNCLHHARRNERYIVNQCNHC